MNNKNNSSRVNDHIPDLSLHGKSLQDFVFRRHLGVILSKAPVNELAGFVLLFEFLQKGLFPLEVKDKDVFLYH